MTPPALANRRDGQWQPGRLGTTGPGARGLVALVRTLGAYRGTYAVTVAVEWANQALTITVATLAAAIVGAAATGATRSSLLQLTAILVALVVLRAGVAWTSTWVSHRLAFRVLAEIRYWLYWALERIAPGGLLRRRSGDLMARVMSDAEALEVFYAHIAVNLAVAATLPLVVVIGLAAAVSPMIAVALVPWLLLTATVPLWLRRRNRRHGQEVRQRTAAVNTAVVDAIGGLRELLAFGQSDRQGEQLSATTGALARAQFAQAARGGGELAATNALVNLGVLSVVVAGAWLVSRGELSIRAFPPTVVCAAYGFAPLLGMLNGTRIGGILMSSADRVFDLLDEPSPVPDDGTASVEADGPVRVDFEAVTFRYAPGSLPAVRDVDLHVVAGETLAIVGSSGAGKSTLANLLLRMFDPEAGAVYVGGADVRTLSRAELSRLVAYVPQDVFLFHDTLGANLRLGAPGASDEDLARCCDAARVTPFLERLPDGLGTVVGERGARLSGGERQRVALARALLRDCPLLVLDESSSQLDVLSEREIQAALDHARRGRTTVVIAHRLSTILTADRIALLEEGRVVAVGTSDELLSGCPAYADLVRAQQDAAELLVTGPPQIPERR